MKTNFNYWAQAGIDTVKAQYPTAVLLEINAWKSAGATLGLEDLDQMSIVFSYEDTKSISISTTSSGTFSEPVINDFPVVEDVPIKNWPLEMEINEAFTLMQSSGYELAFDYVTVKYPMIQGHRSTLYIFEAPHTGTYISVNTKTKEVKKEQELLKEQWFTLKVCAYGCNVKGIVTVENGNKPKGEYIFYEGACTETDKFTCKVGFYGTKGFIEMKDMNKADAKICKVSWDSPYTGKNDFEVDGVDINNYSVEITGKGNSGHSKGKLGHCSMNIWKN